MGHKDFILFEQYSAKHVIYHNSKMCSITSSILMLFIINLVVLFCLLDVALVLPWVYVCNCLFCNIVGFTKI